MEYLVAECGKPEFDTNCSCNKKNANCPFPECHSKELDKNDNKVGDNWQDMVGNNVESKKKCMNKLICSNGSCTIKVGKIPNTNMPALYKFCNQIKYNPIHSQYIRSMKAFNQYLYLKNNTYLDQHGKHIPC